MATRQRPRWPASRALVAVIAIAGFCAAIALVGAGSVEPRRRGGSPAADTTVTTIAVLVGLGALGFAAFVARRTSRPPPPVDERPHSIPAFLLQPIIAPLLSTLLLLTSYALVVGPCLSNQKAEPFPSGLRRDTTTTAPSADRAERRAEGKPNWGVVTGLVLGAIGTALALTTAKNRRRPEPEPDEPGFDDEIALLLTDLDSLEGDPDHRRVVIRTYARMERLLGRTGVVREPWETPQEFLRRALVNLGAGAGAAARLTDLFERARFSTHPVGTAMRAAAAASLRTVRHEIATDALLSRLKS